MADTLTITDNRTGRNLRDPDPGQHDSCHGSPPDQGQPRRLRDDDLRPGVHEHRGLPQPDHVHRRRPRHSDVSRLSNRTAGRAQRLPRDRVPAAVRRAADDRAVRAVDATDHASHDAPREHQEVSRRVSLRRAPDGDVPERGGRAVDVLPGCQEHLRSGVAPAADHPADRQGAEHRRLRVPPHDRPAVRAARTTS